MGRPVEAQGVAYTAAFVAMAAASKLPPDLKARYPFLSISLNHVEIDDRAVEREIDRRWAGRLLRGDLLAMVALVLADARNQRVEWISELQKFQPADGGPHHGDDKDQGTSGG